MKTILHITTRGDWETAKRKGVYDVPSLSSEGFIHCSTARQTIETANVYFRGAKDLVLLVIDESATKSQVKYEPPACGASIAPRYWRDGATSHGDRSGTGHRLRVYR